MTDELDLTPREPLDGGAATVRRGRSLRNILVMGAIVAALGFLLFQALTNARVFFYNVDEAIERREELQDQSFRMQGTVIAEDGVDTNGALLFTVAFGGAEADIRHVGDEPSNLFREGEKVVVEGRWDGDVFHSHQVLVKHSEEYVEDNPDRLEYEVDPAEAG